MLNLKLLRMSHRPRSSKRSWPDILAWSLCGIAFVHTFLLFGVTDPIAPDAIAVRLLQPLAALGVVVLLLVAARREQHPARRWTWILQALSVLIGIVANLLLIRARAIGAPVVTPLTETLYFLVYATALIGAALYFPRRSWWFGSTLRVMLDSATVGYAALVLMQSLLPALLRAWPWPDQSIAALTYLAFNIGLLFALGVVCIRYGRGGGPLVVLVLLGIVCLFIADIVFVFLSWIPGGERWHLIEAPLYTFEAVLIALGAYRSIERPPRLPSLEMTVMPVGEWLLWTWIARALLIAAFAATTLVRPARGDSVVLLLLISLAREGLAAYDQRRVLRALHAAQDRARRAEAQTQGFLDRIIHDLAAPVHGLQAGLRRVTGAEEIQLAMRLQLRQLEHMVGQLRDYRRARHLRARQAPLSAVALVTVCASAIDAIQDRADEQAIEVRLDLAKDATHVAAEVGALRRVLDNLLANALAATPAGGNVLLRTSLAGGPTVRIEVRDSGCGIPPDQQAHVFAPLAYFREGGTGLGLAIVHELVQAMGGTCGMTSAVGAGSSFWIDLRRVIVEDEGDCHDKREGADNPGHRR